VNGTFLIAVMLPSYVVIARFHRPRRMT
jgi:hypothetical protein